MAHLHSRYLTRICTASLLLLSTFLPAPGFCCQGDSAGAQLFQVSGEMSEVRVRLRLPPGCELLLEDNSQPSLYITAAAKSSSNRTKNIAVLTVKSTRLLSGSDSRDLLHTFSGLEAGRQYNVCLGNYVLLRTNASDLRQPPARFPRPSICSLVVTVQAPEKPRWDGVLAASLFGMYILGLVIAAFICWRLRGCRGQSQGGQLTCCKGHALSKVPTSEEAGAAQMKT